MTAKKIDFSIEEPLTDQEKEEYYEMNLYINTFVLKETPVEHTSRIQIIIKPPTAQRAEPHTKETQVEQQVITPAAESIIQTQEPRVETEPENPKYAITKGIIKELSKEIAAARKKLRTQQQQQGKGKHKLIIAESLDDEEELAATTLDIIEDAIANKVPVET